MEETKRLVGLPCVLAKSQLIQVDIDGNLNTKLNWGVKTGDTELLSGEVATGQV